ncbi:response regulator [Clostridium vincentii]|uniref:Stage 0 sporulation protein A homolog n=1 Tax=Clostridium vincentii TaxID=52704 RepID=A0A2T0BAG3_9CLOT|nr:response regulator [Clostridium vincentii]PRR80797.1 Chemotaxis protein CheY [Clostridium vincentii]
MSGNILKILICDDSMLMRKKLKDSLNLCGSFDILEATDGQKAVDTYKANNPNLVFMDIVMPVKDGIQAVSEIKDFDENAKIIMASSSGTKGNLKKAIEAGAFEFIQKPWEQEQIAKIINNFLKEGE